MVNDPGGPREEASLPGGSVMLMSPVAMLALPQLLAMLGLAEGRLTGPSPALRWTPSARMLGGPVRCLISALL